jgi:hypothetical protein
MFRASEQQLTYVGRLIQAAPNFAGPVLLGLAVLSIRRRVNAEISACRCLRWCS